MAAVVAALLSGGTNLAKATACAALGETITFTNPTGFTPDFFLPQPKATHGNTGGAILELVTNGAATIVLQVQGGLSTAAVFGGDIIFGRLHSLIR